MFGGSTFRNRHFYFNFDFYDNFSLNINYIEVIYAKVFKQIEHYFENNSDIWYQISDI